MVDDDGVKYSWMVQFSTDLFLLKFLIALRMIWTLSEWLSTAAAAGAVAVLVPRAGKTWIWMSAYFRNCQGTSSCWSYPLDNVRSPARLSVALRRMTVPRASKFLLSRRASSLSVSTVDKRNLQTAMVRYSMYAFVWSEVIIIYGVTPFRAAGDYLYGGCSKKFSMLWRYGSCNC